MRLSSRKGTAVSDLLRERDTAEGEDKQNCEGHLLQHKHPPPLSYAWGICGQPIVVLSTRARICILHEDCRWASMRGVLPQDVGCSRPRLNRKKTCTSPGETSNEVAHGHGPLISADREYCRGCDSGSGVVHADVWRERIRRRSGGASPIQFRVDWFKQWLKLPESGRIMGGTRRFECPVIR